MAAATQRIPVLVTSSEKSRIAKMAKDAGLSTGEFLRQAAAAYRPAQDDTALEGMIEQMLKTTKAANRALDDALAYVEQSNKRMSAMETKRTLKAAWMSVTEKMWDAITTVIKMNDKIERLAGTVKSQQDKIESLTERVIRLEAFVEMALASKASSRPSPARKLEHKK